MASEVAVLLLLLVVARCQMNRYHEAGRQAAVDQEQMLNAHVGSRPFSSGHQSPQWAIHRAFGIRSDASHEAFEQIAIALAGRDLAEALNWLRTLPEGEDKTAATLDIAYEADRNDPRIAVELAVGLPAGTERDDLLVHAVSQWASEDFLSARDWASGVADNKLRQRLLEAVVIARAGYDPREAAVSVVTLMAPGEEQNRAAVAVVQRWAQSSPEGAAQWVSQFPEGPLRRAAEQNLTTVLRRLGE